MTPVVMEKVKGIPKIIRKLDREISTCFQMIWVMSLIYGHPHHNQQGSQGGAGPHLCQQRKGQHTQEEQAGYHGGKASTGALADTGGRGQRPRRPTGPARREP